MVCTVLHCYSCQSCVTTHQAVHTSEFRFRAPALRQVQPLQRAVRTDYALQNYRRASWFSSWVLPLPCFRVEPLTVEALPPSCFPCVFLRRSRFGRCPWDASLEIEALRTDHHHHRFPIVLTWRPASGWTRPGLGKPGKSWTHRFCGVKYWYTVCKMSVCENNHIEGDTGSHPFSNAHISSKKKGLLMKFFFPQNSFVGIVKCELWPAWFNKISKHVMSVSNGSTSDDHRRGTERVLQTSALRSDSWEYERRRSRRRTLRACAKHFSKILCFT